MTVRSSILSLSAALSLVVGNPMLTSTGGTGPIRQGPKLPCRTRPSVRIPQCSKTGLCRSCRIWRQTHFVRHRKQTDFVVMSHRHGDHSGGLGSRRLSSRCMGKRCPYRPLRSTRPRCDSCALSWSPLHGGCAAGVQKQLQSNQSPRKSVRSLTCGTVSFDSLHSPAPEPYSRQNCCARDMCTEWCVYVS